MMRRAFVDGCLPDLASPGNGAIDGDVRCHPAPPEIADEGRNVIGLVGTERDAPGFRRTPVEHGKRGLSLGRAGRQAWWGLLCRDEPGVEEVPRSRLRRHEFSGDFEECANELSVAAFTQADERFVHQHFRGIDLNRH